MGIYSSFLVLVTIFTCSSTKKIEKENTTFSDV